MLIGRHTVMVKENHMIHPPTPLRKRMKKFPLVHKASFIIEQLKVLPNQPHNVSPFTFNTKNKLTTLPSLLNTNLTSYLLNSTFSCAA